MSTNSTPEVTPMPAPAAVATPTSEAYSVRIVRCPSWTAHQPWNGSEFVPALCEADGRPKRYLGNVSLGEAVAKATETMAGWATPRTVISHIDLGDRVDLVTVVGPVVG